MLAVAIYVKDVYTEQYNRVDLFDDEKISVVSSIQNINDISKTFTDFSQTFTVPASKQNNKIFRHWYDNSNDEPFSTLVKADAYIEIDTITFRRGKIQLESANVEDGQAKDYSITFIGLLGNLKDTFAGLYLKDLTSTTYDFVYTPNDVLSRVVGNMASQDVMFPLISSKRNWNVNPTTYNDDAINYEGAPIRYNELFPALRLRAVLNMIEQRFGINFDGTTEEPSTFLSDARFTNAYLWLKNAETFEAKQTLTKVNFTSQSGDDINLTGYTIDLTNDKITNTTSIAGYNTQFSTWYFNQKRLIFYITPSVSAIPYSIIINRNGELYYDSGLLTSNAGVTISQIIEQNQTSRFATNNYYEFYIGTYSEISFSTQLISTSYYKMSNSNTLQIKTTNFNSAPQTTNSYSLQVREYFPEIKIEDFFSGILKMFNLTCFSNDGINYTVETIDNYYEAGSDVDITKYVIQDKKTLNRVKTHKKINFDYEKSESRINVAFESNAGIPYGSLHYSNIPPAEGEEYSIKLPFEDLNFSNLYQPSLFQVGYALKTDLSSYIPKPIILYDYKPSGTTDAGFTFYTSGALTGIGDERTQYKAFGQETLIGTETYGLNFNEQQSTLTNEIINNGLYQTYYSKYFANIFDFKARLTKLSAILPTSILTTLKLNDTILIRDTKYLINTMTTDLTSGVAQFELLTDQRVVEPESIVTEGLVLNLDAGNPLSYPGTGTTWNDLTTNGNNGTLINGPTFDSANGGSIVFDGTNDYALISPISNITYCTYILWLKWGESGVNNAIFGNETGGSLNAFGIRQRSNNKYMISPGAGSPTIIESTSDLSTYSNWHMITTLINGSKSQIYINGILNAEANYTGQNTSSNNFYIGALYNLSESFLGNISTIQIYNRALSSQEVLQNYNATKGRYGL